MLRGLLNYSLLPFDPMKGRVPENRRDLAIGIRDW